MLQHICPLSTRTLMAMFQVLTEMVRPEELLRLIAFAELVDMIQVLRAPVPLRRIRELLPAIPAHI